MNRILLLALLTPTIGCLVIARDLSTTSHQNEYEEEVELVSYMGNLQRFSQKLGFAIDGKNKKLVEFYLHEIDEVFEEIKEEVEEYEGMPISSTVSTIIDPLFEELEQSVHAENWSKTSKNYKNLIDGCNRCHNATEHEFIKILPASGKSPFNQDFSY